MYFSRGPVRQLLAAVLQLLWTHALRVTRCPFADGGDAFSRRGGLTFLSFSSYVRFDIIRRILTRVFGCSVVMVMGVTDVDDKIIKRANEVSEPGLRRWCLGSQWSHLPDSLAVPTWLAGGSAALKDSWSPLHSVGASWPGAGPPLAPQPRGTGLAPF